MNIMKYEGCETCVNIVTENNSYSVRNDEFALDLVTDEEDETYLYIHNLSNDRYFYLIRFEDIKRINVTSTMIDE